MIFLAVVGWLLVVALATALASLCLMCVWLRLVFSAERGLVPWILATAALSGTLFYYAYQSSPVAVTLVTAR